MHKNTGASTVNIIFPLAPYKQSPNKRQTKEKYLYIKEHEYL